MNAGNLDQYITIKRPTQATGDLNAVIDTWATLASVWAKKHTASAKEIQKGKDIQVDKVVWSMYETDILSSDRIVHESKTYHVDSVIENNDFMIVTTSLIT